MFSLETLQNNIIGQPHVIKAVQPYIQLHESGLNNSNRPVGVIILAGETGTGKTYFVQQLANAIHKSETNMIRIDCAEYTQDHEVAKLLGAPPGYLGHRETTPRLSQNRLTTVASAESTLSIILFDEIEKASEKLRELLLGVFDHAQLVLGDGSTVSFRNTIIFMTTNLGAKQLVASKTAPFTFVSTQNNVKSLAQASIRKFFAPEFLNRVDETIVFNSLTQKDFDDTVLLEFNKIMNHIGERAPRLTIEIKPDVMRKLQDKCRVSNYGGREVKRFLNNEILIPIARNMLMFPLTNIIQLGYDNELVIENLASFKKTDIKRFKTARS